MHIHIAYTIDIQGQGAAQFADQVLTSAYSARETLADGDEMTAHICYANISADLALRLKALESPRYHVHMVQIAPKLLAQLQSFSKHSPMAKIRTWSGIVYARIFLAGLLPDEARVIYLDADTLVRKSLAELWQTDLAGKMLGLNMGLVPEYGYNSGVMLMDLDAMRKAQDLFPRLLQFMAKHAATYYCPDQTVINRFFDADILPIDRRYNYAPIQGALDREGMTSAVIWHWYNGHIKPYVFAREDVGISLVEWNGLQQAAEKTTRGK